MRYLVFCLIVAALLPNLARGSAARARRLVRAGVQQFQKGDFQDAATSFAQADVSLPENHRIAFDQACAYAAQNDVEKAIELFQKAAMSRDPALVASSHYNLGCLAAAQAKAVLGAEPSTAAPAARQQALTGLLSAIEHYRDCLEVDQDHKNARKNLELLRLWMKYIQDVWQKRDRQQRREEMDLLQLVQMVQSEQSALRQVAKALAKQDPSPRRRQGISQSESAQRLLLEEIEPLKEKMQQTFQPDSNATPPSQPSPAEPVPNAEQALQILTGLADQSGKAMQEATDQLAERSVEQAIQSQADALDALNDIYMWLAPFTSLVSRATSQQENLVQQSEAIANQSSDPQPSDPSSAEDEPEGIDYAELSREQSIVSRWSQILAPKAQQQLEQLEAAATSPPPDDSAKNQSDQAPQDQEQLKAALTKAIELGPQIQPLADTAAEQLAEQDVQAALPKQHEALRLLKEIAENLPKQPQDQDQQGQNQQDQQQNDQQNDQQQNQSGDQQQQPQQQPQGDLSRQQAESILRKVRERQRQHRQMQKQLRGSVGGSVPVERDW